jgi:PAS domain S-box-containing protein
MTPRPLKPDAPLASPRRWSLTASPVDPVAAFWAALVLAAANATVSAATHVETHANPLLRLGLWLGANALAVALFTLGCMLVRSFQHDAPPSSSPRALLTSYTIYLWLGLVAGAVRYELMVQAGLHAPPDSLLGSMLAHAGNLGSGALLVGLAVNQYHGFLYRAQAQQRALEAQVARLEAAVAARTEAEARFASLAAAVPDALVIVDDEDRVVLWNAGAERTFGYSAAEAVGETTGLFVSERLRAEYRAQVAAVTGPTTLELTALRRGGEEFPIAVSLAYWESGGRRWLGAIAGTSPTCAATVSARRATSAWPRWANWRQAWPTTSAMCSPPSSPRARCCVRWRRRTRARGSWTWWSAAATRARRWPTGCWSSAAATPSPWFPWSCGG